MLRISTAWKDSALLLHISRALPFWMVSMLTIQQLAGYLIRSWPLVVPLGLLLVMSHIVSFWSYLLVCSLALPVLVIAIRPSIDRKTIPTFFKQEWAIIWTLVPIFLLRWVTYHSPLFGYLAGVYAIVLILFALDSAKQVSAWGRTLWRSMVFSLLNVPFLAAVSVVSWLVSSTLYSIAGWVGLTAGHIAAMIVESFILWPLLICIVTNYYVKKIHDDFDLYFLAILRNKESL